MTLEIPRRKFLAGLVGLVAAPAVVKASNLMRVKSAPVFFGVDYGVDDATVVTYIRGFEHSIRDAEDAAFLEGMSRVLEEAWLYGSSAYQVTPGPKFEGLAPFYNTIELPPSQALLVGTKDYKYLNKI